jgi:membrane protease YdiL (CAAX protease family)
MITSRPLRVAFALGLSAAVALIALYSVRVVPIPRGGFLRGSFVTHSVMLGLSLVIIWVLSRGRPALYGLTKGTYRFKPTILLWVLPTAALSVFGMLASGGDAPTMLSDRTELQLVVFVWFYASICEEVLTRGLLQTLLSGGRSRNARGPRFSMPVVLSGLFFGAMHIVLFDSMGPAAVVPIVLATLLGFLAGRYREATGSLIPAIIVHALFNIGGMLPGWVVHWLTG